MKVAFQDIEAPRSAAAYRDPRADGGQRDVTLTARQVTIGRRLHGVRMKIRVPVSAYLGIAMALEATLGGRFCYKVALRHQDGDLDVLLVETFDEAEAMQMWSAWAQHLGTAMIVEREDGALERFADAPSGVNGFERRRGASPTSRSRGRFARRRSPGSAREVGVSYRGEREIICYE